MRRRKHRGGEPPQAPVPQDLIEACKRGDQRAWAELVAATHRGVYTVCYRVLGDTDDAAEATQETFLKVWRNLTGFRGDAQFTTWLYRVAMNTAISKQRSRARRRRYEATSDDEVEEVPATGSVEDAAGARLEVEALEAALAELSEMYRTAVVLKDVYGLSIEEMASRLGISETAAKVRVHRARKMLRQRLYPEET